MDQSSFVGSMAFNSQTFGSAAANVAAEQVLLELAESGQGPNETLRIWQPDLIFVVLGRGGRVQDDVYLDRCRSDQIPVLRRISGGGTIVSGPGCLMYTVVLSLQRHPALRDVTACHEFMGQKLQRAYLECGHQILLRGHSDLCFGDHKFSGNAMRMGRTHLIYHGTLMSDFDLDLISQYLKEPPRQPDYRGARSHLDFVTNLSVNTNALVSALRKEFNAENDYFELDHNEIERLTRDRYLNDEWNLRL